MCCLAQIRRGTGGWLATAPRGDGHPVFLIPGFLGGDKSLRTMRRFLGQMGYRAETWELGLNLGFRAPLFEAALRRIDALYSETGEKVSLIGQSLGGIYVRELAKFLPDKVRGVISLGSPLTKNTPTRAETLYKLLNPDEHGQDLPDGLPAHAFELNVPPPVPTTSVLSKGDGVVPWQACVQTGNHAQAESIQVHGSHCGMSLNPSVFWLVANRLAQADGEWQKFQTPRHLHWTYVTHRPQ